MVYKLRVSPFRDLGKQPGSNLLKASPPNWNKLIYPSAALPRRAHPHPGCGGGWGSPCPPARGCGDTHGRSVRVGPTLPRRAGREGAVPRPLAGSGSRRAAPPKSFYSVYSRRSAPPQRPPPLCAPARAFPLIPPPPPDKLPRREMRRQNPREIPVPFGRVALGSVPPTGAREGSTHRLD